MIYNPCNTAQKVFEFLRNDPEHVTKEKLLSWHPGKRYHSEVKVGEWE